MLFLRDNQYYEDLYDLFTIESCLLKKRCTKKTFSNKKLIGKKNIQISEKGFFKFILYFHKGERYRNKESTIQEWIEKDRKLDKRIDSAMFPSFISCEHCGGALEEESRHFEDILNLQSRIQFIAQCTTCKRITLLYENRDIYKPTPSLCPKCKSEINTSSKHKNDISIITEKCIKCSYRNKIILDFEKDNIEREQKEGRDKLLLQKYRSVYCLSDEDGLKYIQDMENLKRLTEMMKESEAKKKDPEYKKAIKVNKLTSIELFGLLEKRLKQDKFANLNFASPEINRFVIIPFTVQDSKKSRTKAQSIKELHKLFFFTLDNTNWRLMSQGIEYRMGYLKGKLKGYENEDELAKFIKKKECKKPLFCNDKEPIY